MKNKMAEESNIMSQEHDDSCDTSQPWLDIRYIKNVLHTRHTYIGQLWVSRARDKISLEESPDFLNNNDNQGDDGDQELHTYCVVMWESVLLIMACCIQLSRFNVTVMLHGRITEAL